jgi:TetR/AcrR family transcriptional repressor of nem operon
VSQKAEQKQRSREAILTSASAALRERGIAASSVADVMKGAGLTVGGFYGHFDSKEQMFGEAIRHGAQGAWDLLLRGTEGRPGVRTVVGRYLSRTHRDQRAEGCLLPTTASEVGRDGEPYRSALAGEAEKFVASLVERLGPDRREEAIGLIALMVGGVTLARAFAGTPLSDEILKASRALAEKALQAGD